MAEKKSLGRAFRLAFPKTIPVLTGFLVLGVAYGLLMSSRGYGPFWSLLFGATAFCGSMQFVAVTFLTGVFQPFQVFLMTLMVNARHLFYGLSMLQKYKGAGKFKFFLIFLMCDETFAINSSVEVPEGVDKKDFYFAVSVYDYSYWLISSFLGGVIGNFFTINTTGLDFALTALFVVLFIEQLKTRKNAVSGIIGIGAASLALLLFGADRFVIPAMGIILLVLLVCSKPIERLDTTHEKGNFEK
ncbi:MAG: AzlC family ABC transporter permease [Treponemataceae bacterium]|nr:AzlC family ABC transporter permease [Treponemataceae bacterium]